MPSRVQARTILTVRQRVGPTVKALRQQKNVSLNALAVQATISPSHLSRIERGLTVPSYDVLDRIADALGSDLVTLRSDEESARMVDHELAALFTRLGITDGVQAELLNLSHETRAVLAAALRQLQAGAVGHAADGVESGLADGDGSLASLPATEPLVQVQQSPGLP